jgi:hypothetical protein
MAQHLTERDRWGRLKYPPQVERAVSISPARKGLQYNGAGAYPGIAPVLSDTTINKRRK